MRPRLAAAATLVALLLCVVGAAPAGAVPEGDLSAPADDPGCGSPFGATTDARVSGSFNPQNITGRITRVEVSVTPDPARSGGGTLAPPEPYEPQDGQRSVSFDWSPDFVVNGPHRVTAIATEGDLLLRDSTTERKRTVCLAVPPQPPTGLSTAVDAQSVKVTWKRNPEPDVIGYLVRRAEPGSSQFKMLGVASEAGFTDAALPANGRWRYEVKALRLGVSTSQADLLESPTWASAPAADVTFVTTTTAAPAPTSAPAGTSAGGDATGGGETGGGATGANISTSESAVGVSSNAFKSLLDANKRPVARRPGTPDAGFKELLPFASQPGQPDPTEQESDQELGAEDGSAAEEAIGQTPVSTDDGGERRRSVSFLAGGLLSFVMLMQILWIKGEVKRSPLDRDLETEAVEPDPAPSPASTAAPGSSGAALGALPAVSAAAAPRRRRRGPVKAHSRRRNGLGRRRPAPPTAAPPTAEQAAAFGPLPAEAPRMPAPAEAAAATTTPADPTPAASTTPADPTAAPSPADSQPVPPPGQQVGPTSPHAAIPLPAVDDRVFAMPAADVAPAEPGPNDSRVTATLGAREGSYRARRATSRVPPRSGGH